MSILSVYMSLFFDDRPQYTKDMSYCLPMISPCQKFITMLGATGDDCSSKGEVTSTKIYIHNID